MKKRILTICSLLFCFALILTGCATVGDVYINGKSAYFDNITYFEGQVAKIGDYLYFGNGYYDITADDFNYGDASKGGYLARVKVDGNFSFDEDVDTQNSSPKGIEKVNDKLIGYKNQYMFALGSYLYFTSANTHKVADGLKNDYTQVSIFRVKFNGDGFEELGTFKHDDNSLLSAQKVGDEFYYIISEPTANSAYNVYTIKIGEKIGSTKKVVSDAESVVICDEASQYKTILYTKNNENSTYSTDAIHSVEIATGTDKVLDNGASGSSTTLLGRVCDEVFYSYEINSAKDIRHKNLVTDDVYFGGGQVFHSAEKITNINKAGLGYIFISDSSKSLMYKESFDEDAVLLLKTADYSDILFVDGDYVYYSNSTSISRVNVRSLTQENLVTMSAIQSGKCGYTKDYIYFYAQLEQQDEEQEEDTNYYLYRTDKQGNYQLVGQKRG